LRILLIVIQYLPHRLIAALAIAGLMVGLVTTRVVLSVASITIACNALLHPNVGMHFRAWYSDKGKMLFTLLFVVYLLSGLYSSNIPAWWSNTQNKLPLLAIPFGFTYVESRFKGWHYIWLFIYILVMTIAGITIMGNYALHYAAITESIRSGNAIPTPMNDHIRFSTSLAFSCIAAVYLLGKATVQSNRWWRITLIIALIVQLVIVHFLAVRSGLATIYGAGMLLVFHTMFRRGGMWKGLLSIGLLLSAMVLAVILIKPLNNKYKYFKYEWELIIAGEYKEGHSDAQRLLSTLYGWEVAEDNLPWGTGTGDIREAMTEHYRTHPSTETLTPELPHNQFVYTLAATGIAGLLVLIMAFFYPLTQTSMRKDWLVQSFLLLLFISFMTEHALQIQIGMTFSMLFSCLLPVVLRPDQKKAL
jgi:O-antigen ligase